MLLLLLLFLYSHFLVLGGERVRGVTAILF